MYAYIARHADDDVLFMNWAYEENPPMAISLEPGDESHVTPFSSTTPPQPKTVISPGSRYSRWAAGRAAAHRI